VTALNALAADAHVHSMLLHPSGPPPFSSHAPLGYLLAGTNEKLLEVLSHLIPSHPLLTHIMNGVANPASKVCIDTSQDLISLELAVVSPAQTWTGCHDHHHNHTPSSTPLNAAITLTFLLGSATAALSTSAVYDYFLSASEVLN
jgi:hypothetical protein